MDVAEAQRIYDAAFHAGLEMWSGAPIPDEPLAEWIAWRGFEAGLNESMRRADARIIVRMSERLRAATQRDTESDTESVPKP